MEILFALLILQLGIMAALSMAVLAARALNRAQTLERVVAAAGDVHDSLARLSTVSAGADTVDGLSVQWTPSADGFRVRVVGEDVPPLVLEGRGDRWTRVP